MSVPPAKRAKKQHSQEALQSAVELATKKAAINDPGCIHAVAHSLLRPADVQPSSSWPKDLAWQLTPGARKTTFATFGPKAKKLLADAQDDLGIIKACQAGFAYIVDNFDTLEKNDGFQILDVSLHPLQNDIELEVVKMVVSDNGDDTKDVTYISRHVCDLDWPKMMDVYLDQREKMDTAARSYDGKVHYFEKDKKIYHTWLPTISLAPGSPGLVCKELLQYCEKCSHESPHGHGEMGMMITIDSLANPPHPWVHRDNLTHVAGSSMFPHEKKGVSNIYCVRHQTIPAKEDIYAYLIKGMAIATEQQILYGRKHSTATPESLTPCSSKA